MPDGIGSFIIRIRNRAMHVVLSALTAKHSIAKTDNTDWLVRICPLPVQILSLRFSIELSAYGAALKAGWNHIVLQLSAH